MRSVDTLTNIKKSIDEIDVDKVMDLDLIVSSHKDIIIIGNGGSNAIAQHMSVDYTKFLKKRCHSFGDSPRLTCYMNDYGVEDAYKQYLLEFANKKTLVILISSSGESENIIRCAKFCVKNKLPFVILTGFDSVNSLRRDFGSKCDVDIWVDSTSYSVVECTHEIYLHSIVGN